MTLERKILQLLLPQVKPVIYHWAIPAPACDMRFDICVKDLGALTEDDDMKGFQCVSAWAFDLTLEDDDEGTYMC